MNVSRSISESTPVALGLILTIAAALCTSVFMAGRAWERVNANTGALRDHQIIMEKLTEVSQQNARRIDLLEQQLPRHPN